MENAFLPMECDMNHFNTKRVWLIAATAFLCLTGAAPAVTLYTPAATAHAGQTVEIPVMIDRIDNLAGMKLVLKYDAGVLKYIEGEKTKHTASLMHVVNDKNPGVLIIVMAGARGIKGEDISLFSLHFEASPAVKQRASANLRITELQLMSDTLVEVAAAIKVNDVTVIPIPEENVGGACE